MQDSIDEEKVLPFNCELPSAQVLFGNKLQLATDVLKAKRVKVPEAKIAYHEVQDAATSDDPAHFKVAMKTRVIYVPSAQKEVTEQEQEKGSALQARAGSMLPASCWKTSCTSIVFACRWAPTGLMPVTPHVVFTKTVVLPAGKAWPLGP